MENTTRTPEEARALALERVAALLDAGYLDMRPEAPLLGGLDYDKDRDVFDELTRITGGLKTESTANPTPTMAWQAVCGSFGTPYPWWHRFEYLEDSTTWEIPGTLRVTGEDPTDESKSITKDFTALDLLHAYLAMPDKAHCGSCDLIGDPDDCSSDLILQWAMYGEIVFG